MKLARPELLAPAGSMEALKAAVENGADAVYLGARTFSARGYASNFSEKELEEALDYAHLRGVKVYVTVNTLLKDLEMQSALKLLFRLREMGADAIIIQDPGLMYLAGKKLPDLPLHASTQMTLHNSAGVTFVKEMGIKRVVLSRECSLKDIKSIKEKTGAELEVFIHGALCISYSGQCLLSSLIGGRSGNRGYCAQPCRKRYRLFCDGKEVKTEGNYLLSPKDLNTTSCLGPLLEAGINSLKIEGRMKRPEYVAGTVRVYSHLLDKYLENPAGYSVSEQEQKMLAQLFNRGFTTGYFFKNPRSELMSRENPHNRGIPVGVVVGYNRRTKRARIKLSDSLRPGDGIMIEKAWAKPEDKGQIITALYTERGLAYHAGKGELVEISSDSRVLPGSVVYRTHDKMLMDALKKESESMALKTKIPVFICASASPGCQLELQIKDMDSNSVSVKSEYIVEIAKKQPTSKTQIEQQLSKLGTTLFEVQKIKVDVEGDVFIPVGQLNELRTRAVQKLEKLRISRWKRKPLPELKLLEPETKNRIIPGEPETKLGEPEDEKRNEEKKSGKNQDYWRYSKPLFSAPLLSVSVYSAEAVEAALLGGADRIYFGEQLIRSPASAGKEPEPEKNYEKHFEASVLKARAAGKKIYFMTPKIVKDSEMEAVEKIISCTEKFGTEGVLVSNMGVFELARAKKIPCIADSALNAFNSYAVLLYLSKGAEMVVLSPELTLKEITNVASHGSVECIVHGRLELMESEHCLVGGLLGKSKGKCHAPCRSGNFTLVDEKNYEFPLLTDFQCRTHLLNSKILCMLEYIPEILSTGVSSLRLETLGMKKDEIQKITLAYRKAIDNYLAGESMPETWDKIGTDFTTGHYFRGVQ